MVEVTGVSKNKMLSDIRSHCFECAGKSAINVRECPSTKCVFYKYRFVTVQLNAFDGIYKEEWKQLFIATAELEFSQTGFFPSQIRLVMETMNGGKAYNSSWIGSACHRMISLGWKKTNEHRVSPIPSCNGRHEYKFIKKETF